MFNFKKHNFDSGLTFQEANLMNIDVNNMLCQSKRILDEQHNSRLKLKPKIIAIELVNYLSKKPLSRDYRYFFWPQASVALALEVGHTMTHDEALLDTLIIYYKDWAKKGSRLYFLDQIMNGYSLIYLFENTRELWIEELIKKMYIFIKSYPRTSTESLPYRIYHSDMVLVDYLGMICPFLSRYGRIFKCQDASNLSAKLLNNFLSNGMDDKTGLPYHGFRSNTHEKLGIIGWGRGVGWLLIGIVDTLVFLDKSSDEFHSLLDHLGILVNNITEYQDKYGYFKWMLNANDGHVDTSSTAMIGYSLKRAIDLNLIDIKYSRYAINSYHALLRSTKRGLVFDSLAECQGIGMYPQRYEWNLWGQGFGTAFVLTMLNSPNYRLRTEFAVI